MGKLDPKLPLVPIEQAPYEVRKRWLLEERRNTRIAIAVIVLAVGLLGWLAWLLVA